MNKKVKTVLLVLLAALLVIQFFQIDKTNPESDPAKDFIALENPPQEIATLLKNACYDCHSHDTAYPWYTNVQPVAWWVKGHIKGARNHLNYATWGDAEAKKKAHKFEEMAEETAEGHMPLKSYTWMHPQSKITDAERQSLVDWFKAKQERKAENLEMEGGESHEHE